MASSPPPAGYTARPIALDDVDALGPLFRRRDEALGVAPEPVGSFLRWALGLPFVDPERDTVLLERDGAPVAMLTALRDAASVGAAMWTEGVVDPAAWGRGLGAWLVDRIDQVVAARADEGPFDVHALVLSVDERAASLFTARGYAMVRVGWEMAIDLAEPRPSIPLPAGVTLRTFETGRDEHTFWRIHEDAFRDHFGFAPSPYESFAGEWYDSYDWDPSKVLFADVDGETSAVLAWVDADTDGYVADVSVLPSVRRRGVASALLRRAFDDIQAAGKARTTLTVDSENAHGAVALYEKVGMAPYRTWHTYRRPAR